MAGNRIHGTTHERPLDRFPTKELLLQLGPGGYSSTVHPICAYNKLIKIVWHLDKATANPKNHEGGDI